MTAKRKMQAKGAQVIGAMKEVVGRATHNRKLEAEGKAEKTAGHGMDASEKVKDAVRRPWQH
ncbi:CsbD family protein [Streptomyces sp. DSM 41527]|uniref:CsbD family protein n=1 Tax=Streptomyces mooreae TaxID=3075523 RepID=A0ABU2TDH6_9ACTN|nr:CsbD family protein [Streptomyces sp. DSM 41527]MDT0459004.1 CsbD family protein [Streptomyces sp. DSM 41527]